MKVCGIIAAVPAGVVDVVDIEAVQLAIMSTFQPTRSMELEIAASSGPMPW